MQHKCLNWHVRLARHGSERMMLTSMHGKTWQWTYDANVNAVNINLAELYTRETSWLADWQTCAGGPLGGEMYVLKTMIEMQDEPWRAKQSGSDQCSTHIRDWQTDRQSIWTLLHTPDLLFCCWHCFVFLPVFVFIPDFVFFIPVIVLFADSVPNLHP